MNDTSWYVEASLTSDMHVYCSGSLAQCVRRWTRLSEVQQSTAVIKLGDQGCFVQNAREKFHLPAFKVPCKDTTGAGDTFCGALVAALSQAMPLTDALRRASAAAALACTQMGAQSSVPTSRAVTDFLTQDSNQTDAAALAALRHYAGLA